jgi:hypothetical protein
VNLEAFKGRIAYASELFGVYQPLLGWKSKCFRPASILGRWRHFAEKSGRKFARPDTDNLPAHFTRKRHLYKTLRQRGARPEIRRCAQNRR